MISYKACLKPKGHQSVALVGMMAYPNMHMPQSYSIVYLMPRARRWAALQVFSDPPPSPIE